jgi:hypothetical protein
MAWCPICGGYWIVRTGTRIRHGVLGRSNTDVYDPPDVICPECEASTPVVTDAAT